MRKQLIDFIEMSGYKKSGYGYKLVTTENTHWITVFQDCLQMYAYFTEDPECEKIYDTGNIKIDTLSLSYFINVLTKNHN